MISSPPGSAARRFSTWQRRRRYGERAKEAVSGHPAARGGRELSRASEHASGAPAPSSKRLRTRETPPRGLLTSSGLLVPPQGSLTPVLSRLLSRLALLILLLSARGQLGPSGGGSHTSLHVPRFSLPAPEPQFKGSGMDILAGVFRPGGGIPQGDIMRSIKFTAANRTR